MAPHESVSRLAISVLWNGVLRRWRAIACRSRAREVGVWQAPSTTEWNRAQYSTLASSHATPRLRSLSYVASILGSGFAITHTFIYSHQPTSSFRNAWQFKYTRSVSTPSRSCLQLETISQIVKLWTLIRSSFSLTISEHPWQCDSESSTLFVRPVFP